jgi:NAD(P)-dependent dehydrogenase (short-subunit alcohol dehydrogenase family)
MGKVVLITGISSGFGHATSMLLAAKGYSVYGTLRTGSRIPDGINTLNMDLTDGKSIREAVRLLIQKEGRLDVLINNAGMHSGGPLETLPEDQLRLQIETSFIGMVLLTREVLPLMRKAGGGRIINISSIGGLMGLPFQGFYSAAKFAVEGFSEALRLETKAFNIKVVVVNPGDFRTNNSANRRKYLAATDETDPYGSRYLRALGVIERDEAAGKDPVVLAGKLARIIECRHPRQRYIIASPDQKLAVILKRILPGNIFAGILAGHYGIE